MPLVDKQQALPLPQKSAGLMMASPPTQADPSGMGMQGRPQLGNVGQSGGQLPNWLQNVLSAADQGSTFGLPGMQGAVPQNPRAEIMLPLMMLAMGAEPGPDFFGPLMKGAAHVVDPVIQAFLKRSPEVVDNAVKMGFDTNKAVLHGTTNVFDEFRDPIEGVTKHSMDYGIHVGDAQAANRKAGTTWMSSSDDAQSIIPMLMRSKKTAALPDFGDWTSPGSVVDKLGDIQETASGDMMSSDYRFFSSERYADFLKNSKGAELVPDEAFAKELFDAAKKFNEVPKTSMQFKERSNKWVKEFDRILEKHGYDAVAYPNWVEGGGEASYFVRKPEQLRSIFAQFDPSKMDSKSLMAAIAAVTSIKILNNEDDSSGN